MLILLAVTKRILRGGENGRFCKLRQACAAARLCRTPGIEYLLRGELHRHCRFVRVHRLSWAFPPGYEITFIRKVCTSQQKFKIFLKINSESSEFGLTARKIGGIISGMNTDEIKASMKRQRITRQELAEKLGVSKGTVNNWLCGADPIPFAKQQLIETLLSPAPPAAQDTNKLELLRRVKIINVYLDAEELDMCIRAARACGMELEDWARSTILETTTAVLGTGGSANATSGMGGKQP